MSVLCIERLGHLITNECTKRKWKPLIMNRNCPPLSYLFFADDLLLFYEASINQAEVVNKLSEDLLQPSSVFDTTFDLGSYLGIPLLHGRLTKKHTKGIMLRINSRLSNWKVKPLNMAGRATIAKSVMAAIPLYSMQTLALPKGNCDEIERLCRKFLWGTSEEGRKIGWHILTSKDKFLVDILRAKWALGDGSKIRFWMDPWLGDKLSLYQVAIGHVPEAGMDLKVNAFVDNNGDWWWEKFSNRLPNTWIIKTASFIPPKHNYREDRMFFSLDFKDWIFRNLSGKDNFSNKADWNCIFGIALWRIWQWRNSTVIGNQRTAVSQVVNDIYQRAEYTSRAISNRHILTDVGGERRDIQICSLCPPELWTKVNNGGAFNSVTGVAKAGGIIRDDLGRWIASFSATLGDGSVLHAEYFSFFLGLQLAWKKGLQKIILEFVDKISSNKDATEFSNIVSTIREFINRSWSDKVCHIYREANFAADHLASISHDYLIGCCYHDNPPPSLLPWISYALYGTSYVKNISSSFVLGFASFPCTKKKKLASATAES
ncbi:uncharacterized protein LOC126671972 [Mercurialis annua]|uniref:uncharacterized protein LOC126671972 n=1 Tax=Mercurialis annua TaxID=3986 RepID=UPI0021601691|nr:uncharacterized protein LOC126671972 [Mercurialis annua]